ncbi:hypothetical protein [Bdellovibrio sp. HCB2-146]|uniref:hypothetical protein n=1 Tax=Bdellovibrio sp. HCB2-146 TaxID=3394362 RepID=UPI0039BC8714
MSDLASIVDIYNGNDWQQKAESLLSIKYGEDFQRVPDEHKGDWGIEGYTMSGFAFQCYAPNKLYSTQDLYEHQRSKITDDIRKFKENSEHLGKLIRPNRFSRWIFLTTIHTSKFLNQHASNKATELRNSYNHVTEDFQILVHEGQNYFLEEIPRFQRLNPKTLRLQEPAPDAEELRTLLQTDSVAYQTLLRKLRAGGVRAQSIADGAERYIKDYSSGRSILEELKKSSPEIREMLDKRIRSLEKDIENKYASGINLNFNEVNLDVQRFKDDVRGYAGAFLDANAIDYIARGTISDWLIRCPMDF